MIERSWEVDGANGTNGTNRTDRTDQPEVKCARRIPEKDRVICAQPGVNAPR